MLQLNLGAGTLPGSSGSGCAWVDPNGICVEGSRTTNLPESGGGGLQPRRNLYTGTYQMQPTSAVGYRPGDAPGSAGGGYYSDPGPSPGSTPIPPVFQPEPKVSVDASTIPGQEVTVTIPADQAGQMYPYAKFRIPRWAVVLGGLGMIALVISVIARR